MLTRITLPICNCYLLKGSRPVLVDTGRPRDAAALIAAMREHGVEPADLALILHTHGHWDHAGTTAHFKTLTAAPAAVHAADVGLMRAGNNGVLKPTTLHARLLRPWLDWSFPPVEPDLLIDETTDLKPFGIDAQVISTPGHTPGSVSLLFEGDAIIGDLLMGGYFGGRLFPGRPGLHYFAEDVAQLRASVRKLLDRPARRWHAGHGGPLDAKDVERWLASSR